MPLLPSTDHMQKCRHRDSFPFVGVSEPSSGFGLRDQQSTPSPMPQNTYNGDAWASGPGSSEQQLRESEYSLCAGTELGEGVGGSALSP